MTDSYDVVIVGGGVVGSAIAYFLAAEPAFDGRVLVVEQDPAYAQCSTTLSAGSIRQQFSTPENIELSKFGARFLKNIGGFLAVDGEAPQVRFVEMGYLFLATETGLPVLQANHDVQREHGVRVALLTPEELTSRFPWLRVSDLAAGSMGLANEGWFDPYGLLQGFRRKARDLGACYLTNRVVGIQRQEARVSGISLASGERVGCGVVVDAAGPRAAEVAAMAGLSLPVRPRKRFVYVFDCRTPVPGCPLLIDPSGVYVRPEGNGFICGVSPPQGQDPDCLDLELDYSLFEEIIWPALAHRAPCFEAIKLIRAWAGHYAYNTLDQNAILGPHPEVTNFLFANGFSGHGLQQSPAVGRGLAELISSGGYRSLDLSRFGYERIMRGEPLRELNVV